MVRILVFEDGKRTREIPGDREVYVLGRHQSCDIVLDDNTISRRHARLTIKSGEAVVEDLGSRNGTMVKGQKVTRARVEPGDRIVLGRFAVEVEGLSRAGSGGAPGRGAEAEIATRPRVGAGAEDAAGSGGAAGRRVGAGAGGAAGTGPAAGSAGGKAPGEARERRGEATILTSLDARRIGRGEDIKEGDVDPAAATERLATIYELGQKLCGRLGAAEVGGTFVDLLMRVFPRADRAVVLVEDRISRELAPVAASGGAGEGGEIGLSTTVVNAVLEARQAVLCSDTASDDRFSGSRSLQDLRIKSIMCVPLLAADTVTGMVEVSSGRGGITFTEDDLRLLTGLASEVSIALENARLYEEVEQSRRLAAIGQTVSGVAHCVKNVLNGIDGGLFIAQKALESNDSEKLGKGWEMLSRNSGFLKTLVLDMLDYSKKREPEYEEADLAAYMEELRALVADRAGAAGVELAFHLDDGLEKVSLDARQCKRALLNVVGNAIEATPQGGRVEVRAALRPPDSFAIIVSDTGSGIPEEKLGTIFEPFFSTKGSKGTGLGLPVTRKIIEEHRGTIEVTSTVGEGTTFTITLPVGVRS